MDLHVVLLEEYILLLQKQDDKYVLKFHSINFLNSKEESKFTHSPIIKIATVLVRPVATGIFKGSQIRLLIDGLWASRFCYCCR